MTYQKWCIVQLIAHNVADISIAENILGFKITVDLEEGLTQFCD